MNKEILFKGFQFNDCRVCVNPKKDRIFDSGHYSSYTDISIAEFEGGWLLGLSWQHSSPNIFQGGGGGCWIPTDECRGDYPIYESEEEAKMAGYRQALEIWKKQPNSPVKKKAIEALIKLIQPQLSLF